VVGLLVMLMLMLLMLGHDLGLGFNLGGVPSL